MLRSLARKYEKDRKVACYTVAQASVITGVPAKLINHYLDRELGHLAAIGAGFRAVCKDGLLPVRLNYEYSDSLKEASRLEAIRLAVCNPRRKYVNVSGDQVSVRIDLARSAVTAGLNRFRSATAMIEKNDDVLSGEPCIKGTRISVYVIHGLHGACGRDEVKGAYPDLSDREIDAALMYAEAFPRKGRPRSVGARLEKAKPTRSRVVRVKLPA